METICYLKTLAKLVRSIRKKMRMNQVEFYNFLYPENPYTDENKKKKMNALERVKSKMVDWDLLLTLCSVSHRRKGNSEWLYLSCLCPPRFTFYNFLNAKPM